MSVYKVFVDIEGDGDDNIHSHPPSPTSKCKRCFRSRKHSKCLAITTIATVICLILLVGAIVYESIQHYISRNGHPSKINFEEVSILLLQDFNITKLKTMYKQTYWLNYMTMTKYIPEKQWTFMLTGDNHMMWIRDSSAQLHVYLDLSTRNDKVRDVLASLTRQQAFFINYDPYATAYYLYNHQYNFMPPNAIAEHQFGHVNLRSFELDSGAYFIWFLHEFCSKNSKYCAQNQLVEHVQPAVSQLLDIWSIEQHHDEKSEYTYGQSHESGPKTQYTGMVWSCFRPSDDLCKYGYNVPGNMFAALSMGYASELYKNIDENVSKKANQLRNDILDGIDKYATVTLKDENVTVYCYEVDGFGNCNLMDDANAPSLLSLPYFDPNHETFDYNIYQNTRRYVLLDNKYNKYYYTGKLGSGIGSPHTPDNYVWNMGVIMQGLTASTASEKMRVMNILLQSDGGSNLMHEAFHIDNSKRFTRHWFGWPNALFAEFAQQFLDEEFVQHVQNMDVDMKIDDFCNTQLRSRLNNKQRVYDCDESTALSTIASV